MIFSPIKSISRQLYILQLENYDLGRSFAAIRSAPGALRRARRKPILWTPKLAAVFALALIIQSAAAFALAAIIPLSFLGKIAVFLIAEYFLSFVHFAFLFLATAVISPFDKIIKQRIIAAARKKISRLPNLKIIGITGSYGKTTMKEVVAAILAKKFRVVKTPENINTPLGLSRLILKAVTPETEILIAEMGAYERGDIKALCKIAQPDIAILTGINESHFERFGSLENTAAAKFEIADNAKPNAVIVLNADNQLIIKNYQNHTENRKALFYSSENRLNSEFKAENIKFFEDGSGISFDLYRRSEPVGSVKVPFLGEYIIGVIIASAAVGRELGLSENEIISGIAALKPVPHRLQLVRSSGGALIIDDSYNGNPDGAREAIKVLARFKDRRKIYVTPGLVEIGIAAKSIHEKIGALLAPVADLVVLIRNSATPAIAEGLANNGFNPANIVWFETAVEAHAAVPKMLKPGDVVLFQNDWPDNYF